MHRPHAIEPALLAPVLVVGNLAIILRVGEPSEELRAVGPALKPIEVCDAGRRFAGPIPHHALHVFGNPMHEAIWRCFGSLMEQEVRGTGGPATKVDQVAYVLFKGLIGGHLRMLYRLA